MKLSDELDAWLSNGETVRFGELELQKTPAGKYTACHKMEMAEPNTLKPINSPAELREMAKWDKEGEYRPLKTAPTLAMGWKTEAEDSVHFLACLDAIYPGVFATWVAYEKGSHDATPLRNTLDRQTGMYRFAGSITDPMANQIMRELCSPGCLRKIAWPIDDNCPVSRLKRSKRSIPVICTEACTFAVTKARALVKEAYDKANAPG